jgi:hypothetical protein
MTMLFFCVQHQRQLDPTQIVVIPYDSNRLFLFVACTVFARVMLSPTTSLPQQLVRLGADSAVVLAAMVLCGASPTNDLPHTVCAAVYLALLATTDHPPPNLSSDSRPSSSDAGEDPASLSLLQRLSHPVTLPPPRWDDGRGRTKYAGAIVAHFVVGLNIPFSILRLYDRGWQWQRWPVPVVVASTYGWVLGAVLGLILSWTLRKPSSASVATLIRDE